MGEEGECLVVAGEEFELFLSYFYDAVEHGGTELFVLLPELQLYDFVYLAEGLAEERIEVILDAVIGSGCRLGYLPPSLLPMTAHLLPTSLWYSTISCSSW